MYRSMNNQLPKERALADLERAISATVGATDDDIVRFNLRALTTKSVTTYSSESPECVALNKALGLQKVCPPLNYNEFIHGQATSTTGRGQADDWVSSSTSPCSKSGEAENTAQVVSTANKCHRTITPYEGLSYSERKVSTVQSRSDEGSGMRKTTGPLFDNVREMSPLCYASYRKACAERRLLLRNKRTEIRRRNAEMDVQRRFSYQGPEPVPTREIRARRNRESAIKSRIKAKARDAEEKTLLAQLKSDNSQLRNAIDAQAARLEQQSLEIQQLRAILHRSRI